MDRVQYSSQCASGTASNSAVFDPNDVAMHQEYNPNIDTSHTQDSGNSITPAATNQREPNTSNNQQAQPVNRGHATHDNANHVSDSASCSPYVPCDVAISPSTLDDDSQNVSHTIMPLERPKSRTREHTAPVSSIPPCSPSVALARCGTPSQTQAPNTVPLPSGPLPSLYINSPSADSQAEFDGHERSDSSLSTEGGSTTTSVEIISTCLDDCELASRIDGSLSIDNNDDSQGIVQRTVDGNTSIDFSKLTRPSVSRTTSTSTASSCQTPTHFAVTMRAITPVPQNSAEQKMITHSLPSENALLEPGIAYDGNEESQSATTRDNETSQYQPANGTFMNTQGSTTDDGEGSDVVKTPNVYINGLPPHFPDESLFEMTRGFGNVLSVRTFTRCVGEKMSGYGFVLFDSVDGAERCIETLRKYRNLHPSFSKQVHKIPGTPFANGTITIPPSESDGLTSASSSSSITSFPSFPSLSSFPNSSSGTSLSSLASTKSLSDVSGYPQIIGSGGLGGGASANVLNIHGDREMSFKEKMNLLKDERSTNLYMEGLPLSIDETTLAALVTPFRIVSSRLFQTKLSDPPRMIAFVRLETRAGAEEIIERLHGRVVRGWNDNGGRISVRFADSNEQRELRRSERTARGEEEDVGASGRLSMAQAALLNLRGAELRAKLDVQARQKLRHSQGSMHSFAGSVQQPEQQGFHRNSTGKHPDRSGQGVANGFQHSSMMSAQHQPITLGPALSAVQVHRNGCVVPSDMNSGFPAVAQTRQHRRQPLSVRAREQQEYAQMLDAAMRGVRAENVDAGDVRLGSGAGMDALDVNRLGAQVVDVNGRVQDNLGVGLDPAVVARRLANSGLQQLPGIGNFQHTAGVDAIAGYDVLMLQQARLNELSLRKQQQLQQIQLQAQLQAQAQVYAAGAGHGAERLMPSANITSGHFPGGNFQQKQQVMASSGQAYVYSEADVDARGTGYEYADASAPYHGQANAKKALQQRQQSAQSQQQQHDQAHSHSGSLHRAQHSIPEEDEEHHSTTVHDDQHNSASGRDVNSAMPPPLPPRSSTNRKSSMSTGASDHRHEAITATDGAVISPALTYASQTPSTLSPATPLFNTGAFATPASAPASVGAPKGMRDREKGMGVSVAVGAAYGGHVGSGVKGHGQGQRERAFSVSVRPDGTAL